MDHFVKPDDELALARRRQRLQRNFQGYSSSLAPDLIGLGPSAISRLGDSFSQNARDAQDWMQRIDAGSLPIVRGLSMNAGDKLREHIIMSIACQLELDIADTEQRFDIRFDEVFDAAIPQLQRLEEDGLLHLGDKKIRVLPRGRLLLRNICMVFDDYVNQPQGDTRFSRTL